jgi:putative ATP-dependent endonuclease of OLD family
MDGSSMKITALRIENFRSIKNLDVDLGDTTVFIGPNNAGKTAVLDAVRIALTRRWGQRGTGFTEYDVHLASANADPKTSQSVSIEVPSRSLQSSRPAATAGSGGIAQGQDSRR